MKYLFFFLLLTGINTASGQQKTPRINKLLLSGRWISVEDKNYQIDFSASVETEYYGKDVQSVLVYQINKNTLTARDKANGEVYRYKIVSLTEKSLTLLYLDRGNLLKFHKK